MDKKNWNDRKIGTTTKKENWKTKMNRKKIVPLGGQVSSQDPQTAAPQTEVVANTTTTPQGSTKEVEAF